MQKLRVFFCFIGLCLGSVQAAEPPIVDIQTNQGTITLQLESDKAPITVNNFLTYVNEGYYTNTLFHRVISKFMIQGGGFSSDRVSKATHSPIKLETNNDLKNSRGTIAMARTNAADSATSQFFINAVDNSNNFDPPGYAVFGSVIDGMEVVDTINKAATTSKIFKDGSSGQAFTLPNTPITPVVIEAVRIRQAQLSLNALKPTYNAGDSLQIVLQEDSIKRQQALDLWVAILLPNNQFLFLTADHQNPFSFAAVPFKRAVNTEETLQNVLDYQIPEGLNGKYEVYAIFNAPGSDLSNLTLSLRSNLVIGRFEIL